jgi:hypothetical protein
LDVEEEPLLSPPEAGFDKLVLGVPKTQDKDVVARAKPEAISR